MLFTGKTSKFPLNREKTVLPTENFPKKGTKTLLYLNYLIKGLAFFFRIK
jgi:hypothetical protein